MHRDIDQDEARRILFSYEAHHGRRQVAVIRGSEVDDGIVVEWAVYDTRRTIDFPSRAHAQQFVDEALMALEYLGCVILDWWEPEPENVVPAQSTPVASL